MENLQFRKVEIKVPDMAEVAGVKKRTDHPSINIPLSQLPEAKKWEVGKKYRIALEVVQTGIRMDADERPDSPWNNSAEFDIYGIAVIDKKEKGGKKKSPRY